MRWAYAGWKIPLKTRPWMLKQQGWQGWFSVPRPRWLPGAPAGGGAGGGASPGQSRTGLPASGFSAAL